MLPDNVLSMTAIKSDFLTGNRTHPLIDYEMGGIAIGDVSQGLQVQQWSCIYEDGAIKVGYGDNFQTLLTIQDVTALSLAFDINMRPLIAYVANNQCYLWWYDSSQSAQVTTEWGDYAFPQLSLDDQRSSQSANADVIFSYIKNNTLYMRIQRERFQIEHKLAKAKRLIQIGMMTNFRFGFAFYNW